jgi:hypothetical protein
MAEQKRNRSREIAKRQRRQNKGEDKGRRSRATMLGGGGQKQRTAEQTGQKNEMKGEC